MLYPRVLTCFQFTLLILLCCVGCRTAEKAGPQAQTRPAVAEAAKPATTAPSVKLTKAQAVVREVLDAHGFVAPVFEPGPGSVTFAFSARGRSPGSLDLAVVRISERGAEVELIPYAKVGSSWASLGRLFDGPIKEESARMNEQIRARLAPQSP